MRALPVLVTAVLAVCSVEDGRPAFAQAAGTVSLRYEMPSVLTLHEPFVVHVTVENGLPANLVVDFGGNCTAASRVFVRTPSGKTVQIDPDPATGPEKFSAPCRVRVGQMQRYSRTLLLNNGFRFVDLGPYERQIQFTGSIRTDGGLPVAVERTGSLYVDLMPRDKAQLRATCERLAGAVLTNLASSAGDEKIQGARALAAIDDPVAVESLERVVVAGDFSVGFMAIDALTRIGNAEARGVLERVASGSSDPDLARLARLRLQSLKSREP